MAAHNDPVTAALSKLRAAVIEQNRLGASWHPAVFAKMMQGLAEAHAVLGPLDQEQQQPEKS